MRIKNFVVGLTITIMTPFLVYYGVAAFSPDAKYETTKKEDFISLRMGTPQKDKVDAARATLTTEYEEGVKRFNRTLFFVSVPISMLLLAAGLLVPVPGVGPGLMFGGLVMLIVGLFTFWSDMSMNVRFVSLFCATLFLVMVGWIKFRKKSGG